MEIRRTITLSPRIRQPFAAGAAAIRPGDKPTLKTISQISGLAVPTVSRALSDAPDISADTKRLIRRIADEIGYVPNRAGVRLRTGRTNVIAVCIATEHDNQTGRLIAAIARELRGTPYHIIVMPYFPGEDPLKPIRYIVETGSADAVIFNQTAPRDPRVPFLRERSFAFATHGRTDWSAEHAWFDFDNTAFGRIAVASLARRGRRSVALIAPPLDQNYALNTVDGVMQAGAALGVSVARIEAVTCDDPGEAVRTATVAYLRANPDVDGIVCSSTFAAMGAVGGIESLGRTLGRDVDVFAKGSTTFLKLFRPAIMAVEEDVQAAGAFLARAAMQAVRQPELPPLQGLDVPTEADGGAVDPDRLSRARE